MKKPFWRSLSMGKKKEKNPEEFYKGIIRNLEKRIRELERELKFYRKQFNINEASIETKKDEKNTQKNIDKRPQICNLCGKGNLVIVDILGRKFLVCQMCKDRKRLNE